MSKNRSDLIEQGFEKLNEDEVEFIDQFDELSVGDFVEGVDELIYGSDGEREFSNLDVGYENLFSDSIGYLAEVTVGGEVMAVVDDRMGEAMIRQLNQYILNDALIRLAENNRSEVQKMMDREGFSSLEFDEVYNTLTILDRSGGDVKVTISLDLIHEFEREAEKSEDVVYIVTTEG